MDLHFVLGRRKPPQKKSFFFSPPGVSAPGSYTWSFFMIFVSLCLVFALVLLGMIEADESVLFSCVVLRDVVILMSGLHSFAFSSEVQTPNLFIVFEPQS